MGSVICVKRISRCVERKLIGRFGSRESRIWISRVIFVRTKKEI